MSKNNNFIDISEIIQSKEKYQKLFDDLYNKILDDYQYRKEKINVRFDDKLTKEVEVRYLIINLIFMEPFITFKKDFDSNYLYDITNINTDTIYKHCNKLIKLFKNDSNIKELNRTLGRIIERLGYISLDFNKIIGNTINLKDKIDLSERNKEYNDIIHTVFPENTPSSTIEEELKKKGNKLKEILGSDKKNCFHDYVKCNEGINENQLIQFEVGIGPKPDIQGNVFPLNINSNFMVNGLEKPSDYFIDASGGRKASIVNFSGVKKSGYLSRKLSLLCMNTLPRFDKRFCGTKNYMEIVVTPDNLKKFNERYMLVGENKVHLINGDKDEILIGKKIKLLSPITCACKNGVCQKCYGNLWKINNDIHIGLLGVNLLTSQLTQMLLSVKHLLKTNTKKIIWPEKFENIFSVEGNTILVNEDIDEGNTYTLIINENDFNESEGDFDEDIRVFRSIKKFVIKVNSKDGKEKIIVNIDREFYLSEYLEGRINNLEKVNGKYFIDLKKLNREEVLFYIEIQNNEISRHLHGIFTLIETGKTINTLSKEELFKKFLELLAHSNIKINSVHIELIIREMVRDITDNTRRPDFREYKPEYKILRVSDAIFNSDSIAIRLAFEKLRYQLMNPYITDINGTSYLDKLFLTK